MSSDAKKWSLNTGKMCTCATKMWPLVSQDRVVSGVRSIRETIGASKLWSYKRGETIGASKLWSYKRGGL